MTETPAHYRELERIADEFLRRSLLRFRSHPAAVAKDQDMRRCLMCDSEWSVPRRESASPHKEGCPVNRYSRWIAYDKPRETQEAEGK